MLCPEDHPWGTDCAVGVLRQFDADHEGPLFLNSPVAPGTSRDVGPRSGGGDTKTGSEVEQRKTSVEP